MSLVGITGIRPSPGGLHLGHYIGDVLPAIEGTAQGCSVYFILGDLHLLSKINFSSASIHKELDSSIVDMLADAIACGVDYNDITFCLQSQINTNLLPLFLFFGGLVNLPRIQRLPAIKALIKDDISKISMTTLNFPLIEVIDLLAFRANYVYSNIDNKPFVELANELIERFNRNFEKVFPSPQLVHGKMPFLMGTDGSKMSKSKGNCIFLCDPTDISSSSNVH